jgi:hypothetical protein
MTYGPRNRLLVLSRAGTWVVLFMGRTKHDILARHDKFWVVPARHECEGRVVPSILAR